LNIGQSVHNPSTSCVQMDAGGAAERIGGCMRASRWRQSAAAALKDGRNKSGAQLLQNVALFHGHRVASRIVAHARKISQVMGLPASRYYLARPAVQGCYCASLSHVQDGHLVG
jgi:hypothetical protein